MISKKTECNTNTKGLKLGLGQKPWCRNRHCPQLLRTFSPTPGSCMSPNWRLHTWRKLFCSGPLSVGSFTGHFFQQLSQPNTWWSWIAGKDFDIGGMVGEEKVLPSHNEGELVGIASDLCSKPWRIILKSAEGLCRPKRCVHVLRGASSVSTGILVLFFQYWRRSWYLSVKGSVSSESYKSCHGRRFIFYLSFDMT